MHTEKACKICEKKIAVTLTKTKHGNEIDSEEGVLFNYNGLFVWFCNKCWAEMVPNKQLEKPKDL